MSLKLFLDQKDYSCIARGLCGQNDYDEYVEIYDRLRKLSDSGKITIYYSWSHLVESLRYKDLSSDLWLKHCHAVDCLTKGNCILFPLKVEERELELFLSKHFNVYSDFHISDYPFGTTKDAVPTKTLENFNFSKAINKSIKEHVMQSSKSRKERRIALKNFSNSRKLKMLFNPMTDNDVELLKINTLKKEPENIFLKDFMNFLDREAFLELILGTPESKDNIINEFFDQIFNFHKLVNLYSCQFPELKSMADFPEKSFEKFSAIFRLQNLIWDWDSSLSIDHRKLKNDLVTRYINSIHQSILNYSEQYGFSAFEAEKILLKSNLSQIPNVSSYINFLVEYSKKHIGLEKRNRKVRESDIIDLHNLRNVPYVDYFLTDSFFTEISKKQASMTYGTTILKNLKQLVSHLENVYI